jgi:hypothetical protein
MTLLAVCDVCDERRDVSGRLHHVPEGWHTVGVPDEDRSYREINHHACSMVCLAELAIRLQLGESATPADLIERPTPPNRATRTRRKPQADQ